LTHRSLHNHLVHVPLARMRPNQITVGYAEVRLKREQWKSLDKKARKERLSQQWFPSIIGPQGRYYIVDHHHLGLALLADGVEAAYVMVLRDLSTVDTAMFWRLMEHPQWAHPFDARGRRRDFDAIPQRLRDLADDPYRSLAGLVRTSGGYAKDTAPFSEFLWADFFRPRIKVALIKRSLEQAVAEGVGLARSAAANFLPGWTGTATA